MHSIGLTGGIGSGKSSVARLFAERGAAVCDADEVAHALLGAGGAAEAAVSKQFGPEILAPGGTIDRARLGQRVFTDAVARMQLEAITHPLIAQRIAEAARGDPGGREIGDIGRREGTRHFMKTVAWSLM